MGHLPSVQHCMLTRSVKLVLASHERLHSPRVLELASVLNGVLEAQAKQALLLFGESQVKQLAWQAMHWLRFTFMLIPSGQS